MKLRPFLFFFRFFGILLKDGYEWPCWPPRIDLLTGAILVIKKLLPSAKVDAIRIRIDSKLEILTVRKIYRQYTEQATISLVILNP